MIFLRLLSFICIPFVSNWFVFASEEVWIGNVTRFVRAQSLLNLLVTSKAWNMQALMELRHRFFEQHGDAWIVSLTKLHPTLVAVFGNESEGQFFGKLLELSFDAHYRILQKM